MIFKKDAVSPASFSKSGAMWKSLVLKRVLIMTATAEIAAFTTIFRK